MTENDRFSLLRLLVAHYDELTGYLTRRLGSSGSARDAMHDTYLRLQGLGTVPEVENPRAYLYRVAHNIALDRMRADGRWQRRHLSNELALEQQPSASPSADNGLEYKERLRLLARAVEEMPPRRREVFLLHKIDGLSHAEIAAKLGISRSMVERHIMKAMAHCRARLVT